MWHRVVVWLILRITRPLGRFGRWTLRRLDPAIAAGRRVGRVAYRRARPALLASQRVTAAVERTAGRFGARLRQWTEPVRRAVRAISGGGGTD